MKNPNNSIGIEGAAKFFILHSIGIFLVCLGFNLLVVRKKIITFVAELVPNTGKLLWRKGNNH